MNERMERFIALLNQMFEMDKSDLDFGIYRILNIRRAEIQKFFQEGLPKQIRETLAPFAQGNKDELRQQIANIEAQCGGAEGVVTLPDTMPMKQQYNTLKAQLAQGTDLSALESDVYSALYNFFSRYYDEGDFISKRRYKEGVYAIPYEGEEVKLYWANQDQYYIKTSENFKDYTFTSGDYTVHFLLVDATTEQNNNKETADAKRQFMLFTENEETHPGLKTFEYDEATKTVNIRFLFDIPADKKAKYQELNAAAIKQWLGTQHSNLMVQLLRPSNPDAKAKDQISVVEKHLKAYVAKNSFDYFIHKDLGAFLNRELDFFIKNEVMHLDDLDTENEARVETYIAKVRAIKQVGRVIIRFLAQLENFQRKLWLKKKFVVETNWCITIDRIIAHCPELLEEICANDRQREEWEELFAIKEIKGFMGGNDGYSVPLTTDFLKANPFLVLDTYWFTDDFKQRLLASIDNLDEQCDGLLINSENFQALELLQEKYREQVKCIYIDPPYNAQSSEIVYKNTFKHSSWLSLMENRLCKGKSLLLKEGVNIIAIDEVEQEVLGQLISKIFAECQKDCITVIHNPTGQQGNNFSFTHEYAYFIYPSGGKRYIGEEIRTENIDTRNLRAVTGEDSKRESAKNCFYPIYIKDEQIIGFGEVCPDDYHPSMNEVLEDGIIAVYPIDPNGIERKWRFARQSVDAIKDELFPKYLSVRDVWDIQRNKNKFNYKSVWTDIKYFANNHGTQPLNHILGEQLFSFPKSIHTVHDCISAGLNGKQNSLILDYFAGSGTTGHAVINLNREDGGHRKYILVEMGTYFNTVTKPRIKKVIYSKDWKDGKPVSREGSSHCFKYLRLEQYEDALNNIHLQRNDGWASVFGDDYLINYMLDIETKGSLLNLQAFKTPFSYEMRITEKNEAKTQRVDLCETFNYLIGLRVQHQGIIRCYDSRPAAKPDYEGAVDLVKGTQHAFRQIEGTLPDGRKALVIWRTIGDDLQASNTALDAYFEKYRINPRDREYDVIYVNGDNNLENLRTSEETWKVVLIEQEFNKRMFAEE